MCIYFGLQTSFCCSINISGFVLLLYQYFCLQASLCCSININTKEGLLCFEFELLMEHHVSLLIFTIEEQKKKSWLRTYLIFLLHMAVSFITLLRGTKWQYLRPSICDFQASSFYRQDQKFDENCCIFFRGGGFCFFFLLLLLHSIPGDRALGASSLRFPIKCVSSCCFCVLCFVFII